MKILSNLISCIFPNICAGCGEVLSGDDHFCDYCFEMIEKVDLEKVCLKCGLPKKSCECSKITFHFEACIAPFKNSGVARKAMYAFKFNHKENLGVYFAKQMTLAIKQKFYENDFDIVTYVPMLKKNQLKRGYNQSCLLAENISKFLQIPLAKDLLKCNKKKKKQHSLSREERFENIRNIYYCRHSLNGKRILLIDDIKTTGATFDACAKQLYAAGADSVVCVAGLITYKDKKKGK